MIFQKKKSLFKNLVKTLKNSNLIKSIYCLSDQNFFLHHNSDHSLKWIDRAKIKNQEKLSLNKLLQKALDEIENQNDFLIVYYM